MARIVCFGEILLRLSPPGRQLLLQTPRLDVWVGGAEANVATGLARLGHETAMVSALPDGPLGDAALAALRGHGVDSAGILRRPGRMGVYYVVSGAGHRPTDVTYDRTGSSFATAPPEVWDWPVRLAGAARLHLSGITPALGGAPAEAALAAVQAASKLGVPVSFDGNFRAKLWEARSVDPAPILRALVVHADVLFGSARDLALLLGRQFGVDSVGQRQAAEAAFIEFPRLELIAATERVVLDVDTQLLSCRLDARNAVIDLSPLRLAGIIDRIGAGDAFAAGVLHGLATGSLEDAARSGLRLAALKHSLPGDASLFTRDQLAAYDGEPSDISR